MSDFIKTVINLMGINESISVRTTTLRDMCVDVISFCKACENAKDDPKCGFTFSKNDMNPANQEDFLITIKRK